MLVPAWDDELDICQLAVQKSSKTMRLPAYFLGKKDETMQLGTPVLDSWESLDNINAERLQELEAGVYQAKKQNGKMGKKLVTQMQAAVENMHYLKTLSKGDLHSQFAAQYVSGADETASSDEELADVQPVALAKAAAASAPPRRRGRAQPAVESAGAKSAPTRTEAAATGAGPSASARRRSRRSSTTPSALSVPPSPEGSDSPPPSPSAWSADKQYTAVASTAEQPAAFVLGWGGEASSAAAAVPLHPCIVFPPPEASAAAQAEWASARGPAEGRLLVWWCADGTFSIIKRAAWRAWSDANTAVYAQGVSVTHRGTDRPPSDSLQDEVQAALQKVAEAGWADLPRDAFLDKLFAHTHDGRGADSASSPGTPSSASGSAAGAGGGGTDTRSPQQTAPPSKKRSRAERAALRAAAEEDGAASGSSSGGEGGGKPAPKAARKAAPASTHGTSLDAGDTSEDSDEDVPLSAMAGGQAPPTPQFALPLPPAGAAFAQWVQALGQALQYTQRHSAGSPQHDAGMHAAARVLTALPSFQRISLAEAKHTGAPTVLRGVIAAAAATGKHAQVVALGKRAKESWKVVISRTEAASKAAVPSPSPPAAGGAVAGASGGTPAPKQQAPRADTEAATVVPSQQVTAAPMDSLEAAPAAQPPSSSTPPQLSTNVAAGLTCALRVRNLHRLHVLLKLVLGTFPAEQGTACPTGVIARRLELRVAATVGTPVSSTSDRRLAQWAYMEQSARVAGLPAVFLHVEDSASVPSTAVPASASTAPMASLLSATEWRDARKDARAAYTHGMQVLWSTVAQCSAEPITMGGSRPPPPPAAAWAGTARAARMAQLASAWEEHFPPQLWQMTATPPAAPGFGPLKPSTEDSLAPHVAYLAAWRPPWVAMGGEQGGHPKRPQTTNTPSTHVTTLQAISKRLPQPSEQ